MKVFEGNGTKVLSASTSSGSIELSGRSEEVLVYNAGTVVVFIEFGVSDVAAVVPSGATVGGIPLPPGSQQVLGKKVTDTHVAGITGSGTASVYFTVGVGV